MVLDDGRLRHDSNNLTLVRLLLASSVIYSHCLFIITGSDHDRFATYMGSGISSFAVDGFFFVSGFLVYRSLLLKPDLRRFAAARFARVWPGLAVMVLIVITTGLLYTTLPASSYLRSAWLDFGALNLSFVKGYYWLPGVMCGSELCNVNGSLWTIPWEIRCYVVLGILFLMRLSGERAIVRFVLPATAIFAVLCDFPFLNRILREAHLSGAIYYVEQTDRLWTAFALGIAAYIFRHRIPINWPILLLLTGFNVAVNVYLPAAGLHVRTLLAGYTVLVIGFLNAGKRPTLSATWPDLSYGMYIYAFPVMAAFHRAGIDDLAELFTVTLITTALFATASWFGVERPALNLLKARSRRQRSAADPSGEPVPIR